MVIKVSYVLAILNAERTLKECLDSILIQDFSKSEYEIIIIDGGSTDKTLDIVRDYMKKEKNIKLFHNPKKLSEGKGNGKDQGVNRSKGEFIVFLDHDNILLGKNWLKEMLSPFSNKSVMACQSFLKSMKHDSNFLKYVNEIGVEDPFAVPYSLVSQIALKPNKFKIIDNYYIFNLSKDNIFFFGANGCIFRKSAFDKINGYTRDVDVSAKMAYKNMVVAVPLSPRVYHNTSNSLLSFLKKKSIYFYKFINQEYSKKEFKWAQIGQPPSRIRFFLMVLTNLTLIVPLSVVFVKLIKTKQFFWILHPFYVFYMTLIYGIITLSKIKNFFKYL